MSKMVIYHNNRSVKTIKELMEYKHIFETDDFTYETWFDENKLRIFQQLNEDERCKLAVDKYGEDATSEQLTVDDLTYEMDLPFPCTLLIDSRYVTTNLAISESNFQENTDDFFVFQEKEIKKIVDNPKYAINLNTKKLKPELKVFGFLKTFYRIIEKYRDKEKFLFENRYDYFYELSDYVMEITTNVSSSGGTFKITFPFIDIEFSHWSGLISNTFQSRWWSNGIKLEEINKMLSEAFYNSYIGIKNEFKFKNSLFHKNSVQNSDNSFFNYAIQSNDLLFINFGDDIREAEKEIGMRCFDMIGLVDDVSLSQNANGMCSVTVSGRDLIKLILEDNSLFFNKSTAWGGSNIFENIESYMKTGDITSADMLGGSATPVDRLRRLTGEINIFAYPRKSLDFILKGVIQKLTNIEVVPSSLFESWGNRRTKFNELRYFDDNGNEVSSEYETDYEEPEDEQPEVNETLNNDLNLNNNVNSGGGSDNEL